MQKAPTIWFRRGDGQLFEATEGSVIAKHLLAQQLTIVSGPEGDELATESGEAEPEGEGAAGPLPVMKPGESDAVYLARLNKAHLLTVASLRGLTVQGDATKAQIVSMILSFVPKIAEKP